MVTGEEETIFDESKDVCDLTLQEYMLHYGNIVRGFSFVQDLSAESNWGYNGSETKLGDFSQSLLMTFGASGLLASGKAHSNQMWG
jgi:hypothetical protein